MARGLAENADVRSIPTNMVIAERIRVMTIASFPRSALSRGLSGTRKKTLIVNLPGSTGGVKDGLAALDAIVDHAVAVIRGAPLDHGSPPPAPR